MTLRGIDISSWQAGLNPADTDADFVIVKATGGTTYSNPEFRYQADRTLESGKLLGIYHFANDIQWGSAKDEAEHFLEAVEPYMGQFIPILDWEGEALDNPVSWAAEWLSIVAERTGATPWFYGYASNVNSTDYSQISDYPLWMASYLSRYAGGGFQYDPDNVWDTGDWDDMVCYQYTSEGRISGWDSDLDLNVFYGTWETWLTMCGKEEVPVNNAGIMYQAHIQGDGWQEWKRDGQTAGSTGRSLRLEALRVDPPEGVVLNALAHIQDIGWKSYKGIRQGNDIVIGTTGQSKRLEYIEFQVEEMPDGMELEYQVHEQDYGWLGWTKAGFGTGSDGQARRLEAIRMKLV